MLPLNQITPFTSLFAFFLGLPTALATYYQAWKARQEAAEARSGMIYSKNCLEFVLRSGESVNLVPLDTLHTLPKPGDIVLLPGSVNRKDRPAMSAYRVDRIEHIYAHFAGRRPDPMQARLVKAVAHIEGVVEG